MLLENLINDIKEKTKEYTEIEKVRYVYLKLGSILTFDCNFSFGNSKARYNIYKSCSPRPEKLNEYLEKRTIICRSLSYLLRYILRELNIKNEMGYEEVEKRIKHTYNIVKLQNGEEIYLDLQEDLENIQFKCRPKEFISNLTRDELERIDYKIGYINDQEYYYDEYLDLIKYNLCYFPKLEDKVYFILKNLDYYHLYKGYIELRWFYSKCLVKLLKKESRYVHILDGFINTNNEQEETLLISVDLPYNKIYYYLINPNSKEIITLTKEEFRAKMFNEITFRGNASKLKLSKKDTN